MLKKAGYISIGWSLLMLFIILSGCKGCCSDDLPFQCYTIDSVSVHAYNNADSIPVLADNDPIPGEALLLQLVIDRAESICNVPKPLPFINKAYALKCSSYKSVYNDSIRSINIVANRSYHPDYPTGSDLSTFFRIPTELNSGSRLELYTLQAPSESGNYILTVILNLSDGKTIETTTNPITLTK